MISLLLLSALASTAVAETIPVAVGFVDGADGITQGFAYSPQFVTAAAGDVVEFSWKTPDGVTGAQAIPHSATQSTFDTPCTAMAGGFDSGQNTVGTDGQTVSFNVTGTDPVWFFCSVASHCKQGMVFAINPPAEGNTFDAFQAAAQGNPPPGSSDSASETGASSTGSATGSSTGRPTGTSSGSVSHSSAASHSSTTPSASSTPPPGGASALTVSAGALAAAAVVAIAAAF